jgi:hypothetical protein
VITVVGVGLLTGFVVGPYMATGMGLTATTASGAAVLSTTGLMVAGGLTGQWDVQRRHELQKHSARHPGRRAHLGVASQHPQSLARPASQRRRPGGHPRHRAVQALLGGSFQDGAIAGLASGLASQLGAQIKVDVDAALAQGTMTAHQATTARLVGNLFTSAVQTVGSPSSSAEGKAFASAFLSGVLEQVGEAKGPEPDPAPVVAQAPVVEAQPAPTDTATAPPASAAPERPAGPIEFELSYGAERTWRPGAVPGPSISARSASPAVIPQIYGWPFPQQAARVHCIAYPYF